MELALIHDIELIAMAMRIQMNDDELEELKLQGAVKNRKWLEVMWCLRHTQCSGQSRRWALEEIAKDGSFQVLMEVFDSGHADPYVDIMLPHLVRRRNWQYVKFALSRGISTELKAWVVAEASEHADDHNFATNISHYCSLADWNQVFACLVSRGMWQSVCLAEGISTEKRRWAIDEARKHSDDKSFTEYILPVCSMEEVEEAVPHLASRGMWMSLGKVLSDHNISPALCQLIVLEAIKHADDDVFVEHVLPRCRKEEAEQVLMHLISRGLWQHMISTLRHANRTHRERAMEKASKVADEHVVNDILLVCSDEELMIVAKNMASRGLWEPVAENVNRDSNIKQHVLKQLVSGRQWCAVRMFASRKTEVNESKWAIEEAVRCGADLCEVAVPCGYVELLPVAVEKGQWLWVNKVINDIVSNTLLWWVDGSGGGEAKLWKLVNNCRVPACHALELLKAVFRPRTGDERRSEFHIVAAYGSPMTIEFVELTTDSVLYTICQAVCSDSVPSQHNTQCIQQCLPDIHANVISYMEEMRESDQCRTPVVWNKEPWASVFTETANTYKNDPLFLLHFLKGLHLFYTDSPTDEDNNILLAMFTVFPLSPQLQSVAFRLMARRKRWDILSQACLSHVWEHDRRQLFKAAVEQRQWGVVRQWADYTVLDDQRDWAMKEAFKEKQWEAYLHLADFGLTLREQMHAHYMLAKYGDWNSVLQMMERGGDVAEVRWLLENFVKGRLRGKRPEDMSVYEERCERLREEETRLTEKSHVDPIRALKEGKWRVVIFNLLHGPREDYFPLVMETAIREQVWHVLMHVVRLGMNRAERDGLFPDMVRQRQWAVCRMLLEHGVDVQLCLQALPELMEWNQWILVARVMEYDVDDAMRRQVMQYAFQRRAGALFWHCLTTMKDKEDVSKETRGQLFDRAISRDIWQAVKPLVEDKDEAGIQRRDTAFLEAIEQHLWDVVDHCQLHGADINMKDENGETPLHREVRKSEWKAVEEIVLRDGDPNILDKDGFSVLNRLIHHCQWNVAQFVIKYGADIHLTARTPPKTGVLNSTLCSPLQSLISAGQIDVIRFTLMWCPNQGKGVSDSGETALHDACYSNSWDLLWDLIARKADPLAVTKRGKSALAYAVLNHTCPQRMVAECIRLGFSTHQPSLTRLEGRIVDGIIEETNPYYQNESVYISSPFLLALIRPLPVVARMLYESGSCSNRELFILHEQIPDLADSATEEGRNLYKGFYDQMVRYEDRSFMVKCRKIQNALMFVPFLTAVATTPRSLKSSCRLLISHCLDVRRKRRHWDVRYLPVIDDDMKDYLMFSDLTDPDYGTELK